MVLGPVQLQADIVCICVWGVDLCLVKATAPLGQSVCAWDQEKVEEELATEGKFPVGKLERGVHSRKEI